jgi:transcriptional regulator GlxA family with amidase domain
MQRIGFVVVPDFQVMVFAALSVFELANETAPAPYYQVRLLSEHGGPMRCSLGYSVTTDPCGRGSF